MAGGGLTTISGKQYEGKVTWYVILVTIVAASGALIFGYDIGVSGGVTSNKTFLDKFFPDVLGKTDKNNYCRYDSQYLTLFTSSLYLAGLVSAFFGSMTTRKWGRRPTMLIGGLSFLSGAIINAAAQNLAMLIIGRILLGIGVGLANQTIPLYLSEMAPAKARGALNVMFQLATTIGILIANLINYATRNVDWGWRLSLGLATLPAVILTLGGTFLPETPNSLIERDFIDAGKAMLQKVRGTPNIREEYEDILMASQASKAIHNPMRNLLTRRYRPHLVVATLLPFFQQVTGINAIMFYAPVLFKTIGFGDKAALYSFVITGSALVFGCIISLILVDRVGRKRMFFEGGVQMLICQVIVGFILKNKLPIQIGETLNKSWSIALVALICIYVSGFGWSWGPLGWLVPSEVQPLEVRSAAQSITVSVNFFFTFLIGQAFLAMFCHLEWGIFFLFAGFVILMTLYVIFFLPETKNIPIEEMELMWSQHWFWKRYVTDGYTGRIGISASF